MLDAYVRDSMTLEEIGERHGVTRERVRQLISPLDPTLYKMEQLRRKGRTKLRARSKGSPVTIRECITCGKTFETTNTSKCCCPVHRQVYNLLRYHVDPKRHEHTRRNTAKFVLKSDASETQKRFAQRVLDGVELDEHGKWMIPGSLAWHWALRAHALRWPIFDQLPGEIQQQIRETSEGVR